MEESNKAFESANEDCSNVAESFLEPLRLNLEMPDYSRLDKPKKPPVPEVRKCSAAVQERILTAIENGVL